MAANEDGQNIKNKRKKSRKQKSNEPGILKSMQNKIVQGVIGFFEEIPADTEMT